MEPDGRDGLLISGSLNNGASTPFAQPRGFGNNRPNPRSLYTYAAGLQLGSSGWDARPHSLTGVPSAAPSYMAAEGLGTFQGPVRLPGLRNRINLFVGYQGSTDTSTHTQWTRLPTDLERAGDFSRTLDSLGQPVQVVDPATRLPFEGNVLPAERLSPQAAALLGYYPRADGAGSGRFNYEAPLVAATRQDSVQSRAAYAVNARHQVNGTASYQRKAAETMTLFRFEDTRRSSTFDAQANWSFRMSPFSSLRARYEYSAPRAAG